MTARRAFRIGGWLALAGAALMAAAAVTAAVIGALALAGKVTFPAEYSVGPFSFQSAISTPAVLIGEVCQEGDQDPQNRPDPFCFRVFVHGDGWQLG